MSQGLIEQILMVGFAETQWMKSKAPIIYTNLLSNDGEFVEWNAYRMVDGVNEFEIRQISPDAYEIGSNAKPFATVKCAMNFLQINTGARLFNHLAAIDFYQSL